MPQEWEPQGLLSEQSYVELYFPVNEYFKFLQDIWWNKYRKLGLGQKKAHIRKLAINPMGPFNNYVNKILTIFDHLPTPSKQKT